MSQVYPLFSTPLYVSFIKQENIEGVLDFAKTCKFTRLNQGPFYTSDSYIIDRLPNFKNNIIECVNDYFFNYLKLDTSLKYYFPDSWFTKFEPFSLCKRHFHSNSLFSGVVYIDTEDKGNINFVHPNIFGNSLGLTKTALSYVEHNIFNSETWSEVPKNNKIIIFPSFLPHSIEENLGKEDRYSFAFNILLEDYKCEIDTAKILER